MQEIVRSSVQVDGVNGNAGNTSAPDTPITPSNTQNPNAGMPTDQSPGSPETYSGTQSNDGTHPSWAGIHQEHLEDLRKSGLSDEMIAAMRATSLGGEEIFRLVYGAEEHGGEAWKNFSGYAIPYILDGNVITTRYRMFYGDTASEGNQKRPRYLSKLQAETHLYEPPGLDKLVAQQNLLIITEGEKKAAKCVQEGFPCVALGGVTMWADKKGRSIEKENGLPMSYQTPILKRLKSLTDVKGRKTYIIFDSDAKDNPQVNRMRWTLLNALLFQSAPWVWIMNMPVPKDSQEKMGLDDLLIRSDGKEWLSGSLESLGQGDSCQMTPLLTFPYRTQPARREEAARALRYIIPNHGKHEMRNLNAVYKEVLVEVDADKASESGKVSTVEKKIIAETRIWLSQIIESIDGDSDVYYKMSYVPLSGNKPQSIIGDVNIITFTKSGNDVFGSKGAKVLPQHRLAMEQFWNDAQSYGVRSGAVKKIPGTRKRGWIKANDRIKQAVFVMNDRVICENAVFAADHPECPLIPIDQNPEDKLSQVMHAKGDRNVWREFIWEYVVPCPIPTLALGAALSGLFRHHCKGSENFFFHIFGESSQGKTLCLRAAASAWGNPGDGEMLGTWNATIVGLERRAIARNHMVDFLDESGTMPGGEEGIAQVLYTLANGAEKSRATKDVKERPTQNFHLAIISSGEKQLLSGQRIAGQEVRLIEVNPERCGTLWPTIRNSATAEGVTKLLSENHGWGYVPMIQGILRRNADDPRAIEHLYETQTSLLRQHAPKDLSQLAMRRLKHFGMIMTSLQLFYADCLEMDEHTAECFLGEQRGFILHHLMESDTDQFALGEKKGILNHFLNQLARFISRFHTPEVGSRFVTHGDVFGLIEGNLIYILPDALNELMDPYDKGRIVTTADQIGALKYPPDAKTKRKQVQKRFGQTRAYVYAFDQKRIESYLNVE